jgi:hypothetical protein
MTDAELLSGSDALASNSPSWTSIKQTSRISRTRGSSYVNVCDQCYRRKLGCSRAKPSCDRCQRSGRQCTYSLPRPAGRPRRSSSDPRRGSRSLSISIPKHTHGQEIQTAKDGYFDSNPAAVSPSHGMSPDQSLKLHLMPFCRYRYCSSRKCRVGIRRAVHIRDPEPERGQLDDPNNTCSITWLRIHHIR